MAFNHGCLPWDRVRSQVKEKEKACRSAGLFFLSFNTNYFIIITFTLVAFFPDR
jgi:hypothetical protein